MPSSKVLLIHPTMFCAYLFFLDLDPQTIYYLHILACGIVASLGSRNVYKDILNNVVSPIDRVVMNHQNQTRKMAYKTIFATEGICFFS
jgi:hypothetical protein